MQLPSDNGAECQVVGCALTRPELVEELADIVQHQHFSNQRYGILWDAMTQVHKVQGTVDLALLYSWLTEAKLLDASGGAQTVSECLDLVGTTVNAERYAQRVRDYARRRSIILAAQKIAHDGCHEVIEDVEGWANDAEGELAEASAGYSRDATRTSADAMAAFERRVMDPESVTEGPPLATQFETLNDDYLMGGIARKFTVVMARPAMGKTSVTMSMMRHWLNRGLRGAMFSMEMAEAEVCGRFVAMEAGLDYKRLMDKKKGMTADQYGAFHTAADTIRNWPLVYDFTTNQTAAAIASRSRRIRRRLGGLDFIVVDHFHQMDHKLTGFGRDDSQMKQTSATLRDLAKVLDCAVILLAQLSRRCEERADKKPITSDARECGALEEDAQLILSPFWPWYYRQSVSAYRNVRRREAELLILKNRDGGSGIIQLDFQPELVRYAEAA